MTKLKKYMHTIGGIPAQYDQGEQIYYAIKNVKLVDSIKVIKQEQKLSREWRKKMGFDIDNTGYGHVLVNIEDDSQGAWWWMDAEEKTLFKTVKIHTHGNNVTRAIMIDRDRKSCLECQRRYEPEKS